MDVRNFIKVGDRHGYGVQPGRAIRAIGKRQALGAKAEAVDWISAVRLRFDRLPSGKWARCMARTAVERRTR